MILETYFVIVIVIVIVISISITNKINQNRCNHVIKLSNCWIGTNGLTASSW